MSSVHSLQDLRSSQEMALLVAVMGAVVACFVVVVFPSAVVDHARQVNTQKISAKRDNFAANIDMFWTAWVMNNGVCADVNRHAQPDPTVLRAVFRKIPKNRISHSAGGKPGNNMVQPKKIVQETFDGVVRENIEEFDMELEEAVSDAKEQFSSQGVDLSNIVTSFFIADDGSLRLRQPVKGKYRHTSVESSVSTTSSLIAVYQLFYIIPE